MTDSPSWWLDSPSPLPYSTLLLHHTTLALPHLPTLPLHLLLLLPHPFFSLIPLPLPLTPYPLPSTTITSLQLLPKESLEDRFYVDRPILFPLHHFVLYSVLYYFNRCIYIHTYIQYMHSYMNIYIISDSPHHSTIACIFIYPNLLLFTLHMYELYNPAFYLGLGLSLV